MSGAATRERLLVVGASGLVGGELARRAAAAGHEILGVARHVRGAATVAADLGDRTAVDRLLGRFQPTAVAVCSAWSWVDGCERDPERSRRENVDTVATLVTATRGAPVRLLFYSTDHVFDGTRESYVEDDAVHPLGVYARDKRRAEEMLLEHGRTLIARTAWVFGPELAEKNFAYTVMRAARAGTGLAVPAGQAGCPTFSGWLADATLRLLADSAGGIVHLTGDELLTKAAWARLLITALGLPPCEVHEVPWDVAGQVAPRPRSVRLRSTRHALVHPPLGSVLHGLRDALTLAPATTIR